ncbi:hypothetical protein BD414DRAFT_509941, partial [Trametes punicea]
SAAETWFKGLLDDVRTDWKKISDAFVEEWYQEAAPPLSDAEALEYICQTMPTLEELLKFDTPPNSRPVACHIQWAHVLYSQARAEGYSNSLADQVTSWKALLEACQNVDTSKLRELVTDAVEDAAKQKALEERVASVEGKRTAPSPHANKNALLRTTTSVDDLAQQMNTLVIRTAYLAAVRRPEHSPQQRLQALIKNALPPPPLTDEGRAKYTAQVEDWHRANTGLEPDEERPYPLTPGTLPVAHGECYTCGMPRHIRPGQQFAPASVQFVSSDSPLPHPYATMPYPYPPYMTPYPMPPPGHAYPGTYDRWQNQSTNVPYGQAEDQGNV